MNFDKLFLLWRILQHGHEIKKRREKRKKNRYVCGIDTAWKRTSLNTNEYMYWPERDIYAFTE